MFSMLGAETTSWLSSLMDSLVNTLTLETVLYIFGGAMLAFILINTVTLFWSYESRSIRAIKRVNKYLVKHPSINDTNLVEFNSKMKKLPMRIRERWQLFMLERIGSPSRYLSVEYCVKRPLYNSAILQSQHQFTFITILLSALSLILGITLANASEQAVNTAAVLSTSFMTPVVVVVLGCLYLMVLNARYKYINKDFYDIFAIFVRNVDKASNSMPDYVDYELLFTKKEIDRGIPVLREYLEKKALEEQRLLERAKRDEIEHSPYNFEDLGINGAQLISRAIDESEEFLLHKLSVQEEIVNLEKQYQATEQNMDDMEREANKKLQAIKENLERLDAAIQETTNRVEINYNRRQAKDEMDKKIIIEKDLQSMLEKEKVQQDSLRVEIEKRKEDINNSKASVEFALKAEYNTFATRVYDEIFQKVSQDTAEIMHDYETQIGRLKSKLREFDKLIERKDLNIQAKIMEIENLQIDNSNLRAKLDKKSHKRHHNNEDNSVLPNDEVNLISASSGLADGNTTSDFHQLYDENGHLLNFNDNTQPTEPVAPTTETDNEPGLITMPDDIVLTPITAGADDFGEFTDMPSAEPVVAPVEETKAEEITEPAPLSPTAEETPSIEATNLDTAQPDETAIPAPEVVDTPAITIPEETTPQEPIITLPEQPKEKPQPTIDTMGKVNVEWANPDTTKGANDFVDITATHKDTPESTPAKKKTTTKSTKTTGAKSTTTKSKTAKKSPTIKSSTVKKMKDKKDEKSSTTKKSSTKSKTATTTAKKKEDQNAELKAIQDQIAVENKKLKKQQQELRSQIDETLNVIDAKPTKTEKQKRIKEIKTLIDKLRDEAKEAKARGASKTELNKINKNIAELLKTIADYQSNN